MQANPPPDIAQLMLEFRAGNKDALRSLVDLFYPELRRIASARMRGERRTHTLQPTALVSELYLEMMKIRELPPGSRNPSLEKAEFLRLAAFLMRRKLIHHARPPDKHVHKVPFEDDTSDEQPGSESLLEVEQLLDRLGEIDPKVRQVVEMRVFEEMTREEIALEMNCSVRNVARYWSFAQEWLASELHV
jgi:RNA polymerase sigma factor (TIGR02999 family)